MADIRIEKDSKLIKVLADQARGNRVDSANAEQAAEIINELAKDLTAENRKQIAETVAFTVEELQKHELDFLNLIADVKNVNYGDKAVFNIRDRRGITAHVQAKGATTRRSYVGTRQVALTTVEISARPAINIVDLRYGRVNMADLIREANREITNKKLQIVETELHNALENNYAAPFYGTGTGLVKATLDAQLAYFSRLGPVTLLGDQAAVSQVSGLTGMQMDANTVQRSGDMLNEFNENGFIGKYNGVDVVRMLNTYADGGVTPVLDINYLYIIPGSVSNDMRNLKVVNEGPVSSMESQSIDDMTFEVRLDQWFGAKFVAGATPAIGAYKIGA